MRKALLASILLFVPAAFAQSNPGAASAADPWKSLHFLEGTWDAKTQRGSAGAQGSGTYTFQMELGEHVLARHSAYAGCKGPADFDCEHADLFYVYQDAPGTPLKAIYFDNEGHVIHYDVSTPASATGSATAVFTSDASHPGPRFRLIYDCAAVSCPGNFRCSCPDSPNGDLTWNGAAPKSSLPIEIPHRPRFGVVGCANLVFAC